MTGPGRLGLLAALVLFGAGWGVTEPLGKIAVSGGYRFLGLTFWQAALTGAVLALVNTVRGGALPRGPRQWAVCLVIALTGTVLPGIAGYEALRHLPAGIVAIAIATVPVFAFPIAVGLRTERFEWGRLAGVLAGMAGVALLIGPHAALPDRAMAAFIPLALVPPLLYACEANFVARCGLAGLDPVPALLGASILAAILTFPAAVASGQWIDPRPPWDAPDMALMLLSAIHALVYSGYVWIVGRAGATFASLTAYLVTGFGVLWSILLLSESYSGYVWSALLLMFLALFLVQPRAGTTLASGPEPAMDAPPK